MMGYRTRTLEMFLLGYLYRDMAINLFNCLQEHDEEFTREEVFEFAKAYDEEYNLGILKKLTELEKKQED